LSVNDNRSITRPPFHNKDKEKTIINIINIRLRFKMLQNASIKQIKNYGYFKKAQIVIYAHHITRWWASYKG